MSPTMTKGRKTASKKLTARTTTANGASTWTGLELSITCDGQKMVLGEQLTRKQISAYFGPKITAMIDKHGPGDWVINPRVFHGPMPTRTTRSAR